MVGEATTDQGGIIQKVRQGRQRDGAGVWMGIPARPHPGEHIPDAVLRGNQLRARYLSHF